MSAPLSPLPPGGRRATAVILLVGLAVFLPALRSQPILDDHMHAALVDGSIGVRRGPFDIYDFVNDRDRAVFVERGLLPWWADPRLRIRFFRPLASALRYLDERLVPGRPLPMHLHSFLWWAAAVAAVSLLLRRVLPGRAATLGTAIFALGPWHVLPLAWLANREVLVSTALGALALERYLVWRRAGRGRDAALAGGLFALALLGGEYALCFAGYVVALEATRRRERAGRRLLGVLPFAVPAVVYLAVHLAFDYGSYATTFYADPLHEPLSFLRAAPARLASLLAEGWLTLGTDPWGTTWSRPVVAMLVLGAAALLVVPLGRAFAALDGERRGDALWLLAGSLLSLGPVLAAPPAPRLLMVSAVGMAATIGLLLDRAWFPPAPEPRRGAAELTALVAMLLGFLQLVHGPAAAWLGGGQLREASVAANAATVELAARLSPAARGRAGAVVVARGTGGAFFTPFALAREGAAPANWRILAHGGHVLALRRGARELELRTGRTGSLVGRPSINLFRSPRWPLRRGDAIRVPGLRVDILDVGPAGPTRARYTFDRDLDDATLAWIHETGGGFQAVSVPPVGMGAPLDP